MFSKNVVQTDRFLEMPISSQLLYFHLGVEADDDGFVTPLKIMRMVGINNADDMKVLEAKQFIIKFNDGVVVIRDWKINNEIKNDRYNETQYKEHRTKLSISNGVYSLVVPVVSTMDPQVRLGKVRLGKEDIITPVKKTTGAYDQFINKFNEITKRKFTSKDQKARRQFEARLKEGYTIENLENAIKGCLADDFHRENNYKYLTPEFITRSDKLEKYMSAFTPSVNMTDRKLTLRERFEKFNS